MGIGANYLGNGNCEFVLWAPLKEKVFLHLISPDNRVLEMKKGEWGYFSVLADGIIPGAQYVYKIGENEEYPDPASQFQAKDVHGPSEVIDHSRYQWKDTNWKGVEVQDMIIYELHIGTFTEEGTFNAMVSRLDELVELGINAIELMPISQFSGNRNWGYDGVYIYAVHNTYGRPDDLKRFVDECHLRGIAVILDVVYNHLGPEGNYLSKFGPYFTDLYCTPWGDAVNFDGEHSDGVRDFFSDNALYWFDKYHIDGLRLDATHMVYDNGAIHFWEYTSQKVKKFSREKGRIYSLIGESDLNGLKPVKDPEYGGFGFDAIWLDDFHHALYVLLDQKGQKYYKDFGDIRQLKKALKEGFVHSGQWVEFRKRKHGTSSAGVEGNKFVAFSQNHDQIGNRMLGERNSVLMSFEALKLAAAVVILSPYVPMLFMGEEYAEENPFLYFISHLDGKLVELVRKGRKEDFESFNFQGEAPDPQSEETFNKSKLQWFKKKEGKHRVMWEWYKQLIKLRKEIPAFKNFDKKEIEVDVTEEKLLIMTRRSGHQTVKCFFNLSMKEVSYLSNGIDGWKNILQSSDKRWAESGGFKKKEHPYQMEPLDVIVLLSERI